MKQVCEGQAHDLYNSVLDTEPSECLMLNIRVKY